jgi:hypothetical protein
MDIEIRRTRFTPNSTMGEVYLDGTFECYSLEPAQSAIGSTGIVELVVAGTYQGVLELSPRFGIETPHLRGVPGYDDSGPHGPIEIHWGNYPGNTEGCCLVGMTQSEDFVGNSRDALTELLAKLPRVFTVTYTNPLIASSAPLA